MKIANSVDLYIAFLKINLLARIEYRTDFWILVIAKTIEQCSGLIVIWTISDILGSVVGWSAAELMVLYGISSLARGLAEFFLDGPWLLPSHYIRFGVLDQLLVRPVSPLFHLILNTISVHGLGAVLPGILLVVFGGQAASVSWSLGKCLILFLAIITGAFIHFYWVLIAASLAFWWENLRVMRLVSSLNDFSRYPITIYDPLLAFVITFIAPFALVTYFPALYILKKSNMPGLVFLAPFVALVLGTVAHSVWNRGLRRYYSAGH